MNPDGKGSKTFEERSFFKKSLPLLVMGLIPLLPFGVDAKKVLFVCYLFAVYLFSPKRETREQMQLKAARSRELKVDQSQLIPPSRKNSVLNLWGLTHVPFRELFSKILTKEDGIFALPEIIEELQKPRSQDYALANLETDGNCFGLMRVWYVAKNLGYNSQFFCEINEIARKAQSHHDEQLTPIQQWLIGLIAWIQQQPQAEIQFPFWNIGVTFTSDNQTQQSICIDNPKQAPQVLAHQVIETALKNLNHLVEFRLQKNGASRSIGVVSERQGQQVQITIFDPNYPLEPFQNQQNAIEVLQALLQERYQDYLSTRYEFPNVLIKVHKMNQTRLNFDPPPNLFNPPFPMQGSLVRANSRNGKHQRDLHLASHATSARKM